MPCDSSMEVERLRATCTLPEGHPLLRLVSAPVMLVAFDPFGRILCWNDEAERVTGFSLADLRRAAKGDFVWAALFPDPLARAEVLREWAHRGNAFQDWRLTITRKDGRRRVISWSSQSDRHPVEGWGCWLVGREVGSADLPLDPVFEPDYRIASMGESRLALRAGYSPKTSESPRATIQAMTSPSGFTTRP